MLQLVQSSSIPPSSATSIPPFSRHIFELPCGLDCEACTAPKCHKFLLALWCSSMMPRPISRCWGTRVADPIYHPIREWVSPTTLHGDLSNDQNGFRMIFGNWSNTISDSTKFDWDLERRQLMDLFFQIYDALNMGNSHGKPPRQAPQSAETLGAVKSSLLQRSSATAGGAEGSISGCSSMDTWLVVTGTWLLFSHILIYIGNNHPKWLSYFSDGLKPTRYPLAMTNSLLLFQWPWNPCSEFSQNGHIP